MTRYALLWMTGLSLLLTAAACESKQQVSSADDDIANWTLEELTAPVQRPKKDKGWAGILPWNWGEDKMTKKDEALFAEMDDDKQKPSFWQSLAFWDKGEKSDMISEHEVRTNLSPELETVAERGGEADARWRRSVDTNGRAAWDDLMAVFLVERPSRSARLPIP